VTQPVIFFGSDFQKIFYFNIKNNKKVPSENIISFQEFQIVNKITCEINNHPNLPCSHLGVDNGPGWVGAASKPPPSPIHGWKQAVHTEPILSHGLAGFGLNGFAGFRMGIFG
jgi:hypothetical protein